MTNILGIQILGALFALFMAYYTFLHYKRKEVTTKEYAFWLFFWLLFITVALFPSVLDPIIRALSLARALDFLIILGFMFILGCVFYTYLLVRKNQKRLEEIVRKLAFERSKK